MAGTPEVRVRRVYDQASPDDGQRFLVDRLWPRGLPRTPPGCPSRSRTWPRPTNCGAGTATSHCGSPSSGSVTPGNSASQPRPGADAAERRGQARDDHLAHRDQGHRAEPGGAAGRAVRARRRRTGTRKPGKTTCRATPRCPGCIASARAGGKAEPTVEPPTACPQCGAGDPQDVSEGRSFRRPGQPPSALPSSHGAPGPERPSPPKTPPCGGSARPPWSPCRPRSTT